MNKLLSELQRLYFSDGQQSTSEAGGERVLTAAIAAQSLADEQTIALDLVGADGRVRALVVAFEKSSDWQHAARLYQALQNDLDLPAPALSVSGHQGYAIWFSLAEAIPLAQAGVFLAALRATYLAEIPANRLDLRPAGDAVTPARLAPGRHPASGKWSAFIDPTLGGMFIDEPWLEMAPNQDRQADLLAALKSISSAEFQQALSVLQLAPVTATAPTAAAPVPPAPRLAPRRAALNVGTDYRDPQSFLLAVMNDASASPRHRIAAAKALLPGFAAGVAVKP